MRKHPLTLTSLLIAASLTQSDAWAGAAKADIRVENATVSPIVSSSSKEQYERDVDQVALASQESAASKLAVLLKKYRGTRQEPILLAKMAELQQQNASIRFRIAHGAAHKGRKALDLGSYKKMMRSSISTLDELIRKYPGYEEIAQAYFMRGRAFEEIEEKAKATKDYLHLVRHYPDLDETISAYMSLAEFSIAANDHAKAIGYLREVENNPGSPRFPFALYKLAWAHYNLKQIPEALSYVEKHIGHYNEKKARQPQEYAISDESFRENMLQDATVFFIEGYEQKKDAYRIDEALAYFRSLDESPILGRMLLRFAKLLRSHGHESDLDKWKEQILQAESDRPESLDVLITVYENQLNKRRYPALMESAQDMIRLYGKHPQYPSFPQAQKLLLDTAGTLQTIIVKNKGAQGVSELSGHLATVYDAFTRIVDEKDPRIPGVHYNLAETLFEIKDFEKATLHYRWVVDHGKWRKTASKEESANVADSSLKAISSRYETLRQKQLIAGALAPRKLTESSDSEMNPLLKDWVEWIDTHIDRTDQTIDNFYFEANRALYSQGRVEEAVKRLQRFALKHPGSRFAVPSASLAIDTYVATAAWEETYELAHEFLDIDEWKKNEFSKRLLLIAADAFYKTIELKYFAKDYSQTLKLADRFMERYPTSPRVGDCLSIAGRAAIAAGDKRRADGYYARLIAEAGQSETVGLAFLSRAGLAEERYQFALAAENYRGFFLLPPSATKAAQLDEKKELALKKKTLAFAWLSGKDATLKLILETAVFCKDELAAVCDQYAGLRKLQGPAQTLDSASVRFAFERAKKGENPAIWGTVALEQPKEFDFRERLLLIRRIGAAWESLEPIVQFTLAPRLAVSVPLAFQLNRLGISEVAPLRALASANGTTDARYLTRRVEAIREIENGVTAAMKLPWARIRAQVLNELATLYVDLARDIRELPVPKTFSPSDRVAYDDVVQKLVLPFEEKGQELRSKAFEVASRFAIEDDAFRSVADPFFQDNPSQAKALKPKAAREPASAWGEESGAIELALLKRWDTEGDWKKSLKAGDDKDDSLEWEIESTEKRSELVKILWVRAIRAKRWPQVAFLLQEAREKKLLTAPGIGIARAIALAGIRAQGEALEEIQSARKELAADESNDAALFLIRYYYGSCARERTRDLVKTLKSSLKENDAQPDDRMASVLAITEGWSGS